MDESEIAKNLLPSPPERIGPYRLEDQLGVGGMGAVYRAYDERLERPVAIKHILPELAGNATAWKRLRREAKAVARMNHPAIVQIYDIVEHDSGDWIVMELVDGKTLFSMLENGPLELPVALDLIRQITAGLAAAHAKGVVHRDLKTENVMVTTDGQVKILDFGLAKAMWRGADKSLSIEGSILGTGRAMSPEQALSDEVSHRSDLFSLGTLIYETTTGEAPFTGQSIFRVLAQVCSEPHPPPRAANPELPEELADLIDRLLEKDPEKRPASATEVLEVLGTITLSPRRQGAHEAPPRRRWARPDLTASGTGMHAAEKTLWLPSPRRRKESTSSIHIRTLLRTTIKKPQLLLELGGGHAQEVALQHDRLVRGLLAKFGGLEIDKFDDGFLLLFKLPSEAVSYALFYRQRLADFRREEGVDLGVGTAIHLGEMHMTENLPVDVSRGANQLEVTGPARLIVTRAAELAGDGQILMTQMAYELARRTITGEEEELELEWAMHGRYRFRDTGEDQPIFEVGLPGETSSRPPGDTPVASLLPAQRERERPAIDGRRRWILPLLAAIALALALAVYFAPDSGEPVVSTPARPAIAVLGFRNAKGRSDIAWLSTALSELFATDLATGGELRLIPGESIARMKHELSLPDVETLGNETLEAIAQNLGTDYVLLGSYLPGSNAELRLLVRLQDTRLAENIFALSDAGTEDELFEMVSRIGTKLRSRLKIDELSAAEVEAVRATLSTSAEANRLYSEGLEKLRSFDVLAARELLLKAVAIEPGFALAHAALSEAWRALGFDQEALASAENAFEQAEGLPREQVLSIQGRFYEAASQWQEAIDTFRSLSDFFPDNVDYGLRLAEVQTSAGRVKEALLTVEELRGLPAPARDDPRIDLAQANAAYPLSDYQAMVAATTMAETKGRALKAKVLVAEALYTKGRALRRLGRNEAAVEALEEARTIFARVGDRGKVAQALTSIAVLAKFEGDLTGAEKLYRQALSIHQETGNRKKNRGC